MSAREMFKKLKYIYFENETRITYENYEVSECKLIEFDLIEKKMILSDDSRDVIELCLEEIQAIAKQIEELEFKG